MTTYIVLLKRWNIRINNLDNLEKTLLETVAYNLIKTATLETIMDDLITMTGEERQCVKHDVLQIMTKLNLNNPPLYKKLALLLH